MSSDWVPPDHDAQSGGLQQRVASGLTWTLIDTWGSQLIQLVVFVFLARLLTPVDFGLVALAAVFVAFAQLLVDQGLGDALVQRRTLTRLQVDTAFWAALLTGSLLTIVFFLLAGPISTLVGEPRLVPILQILSLSFVLAALSSIQVALLRREMAFRSLAVRRLVGVLGGGIVGIALAFLGWGPGALVAQQLVGAAIAVVALWAVSPWRPRLSFSFGEFRSLFAFGVNVVGSDVLQFLSRNTDNLLIGVFLGTVPLGIYAIGYRLLETSQVLLVNAAGKVFFPTLSRLQHDADRLRRAYLRMTRAVGAVTLPGYVGLALIAQELAVVVLGPQWAESGIVASILFLIGPVLTLQGYGGVLFNSVGRPDITLRLRFLTTATNVAGFLVAVLVFRNIFAVAIAFVVRGYLLAPLVLYWMRVYAGIPVRENLSRLRGVAPATIAMALAVIAVKIVTPAQLGQTVLLAAEIVVGAVAYLVALLLMDRGVITEVIDFVRQMVPGRRQRSGAGHGGRGRRQTNDVTGVEVPQTALDPEIGN